MNTRTSSARRPQTNQSSIRTAIKKIIRLGTKNASGQERAIILPFFAMGSAVVWMFMGIAIRECNDSVVMELANRSSIEESIQCLIFHKECRCRISPNETLFFDRCLSSAMVRDAYYTSSIICSPTLCLSRIDHLGNRWQSLLQSSGMGDVPSRFHQHCNCHVFHSLLSFLSRHFGLYNEWSTGNARVLWLHGKQNGGGKWASA